jgi:hypothetical protein
MSRFFSYPPRTRHRPRLILEQLETRLAPATITGNSQLLQAFGQLPLSFEANQGQTAAQVDFLSRGNGYALFLAPDQAVLALQKPTAHDAGGLCIVHGTRRWKSFTASGWTRSAVRGHQLFSRQ